MTESRLGIWGRLSASLPSLERIDRNIYGGVAFGFPLLTMTIITGAVWAQFVWQRWWSWDAKETASLVTWLIYAGYLHGRRVRGWRGKTSATIVLVGFLAVLFTFAGVNFLQSMHSYGLPAANSNGRLLGGFDNVALPEAITTGAFFLCYLVAFFSALAGGIGRRESLTKAALWLTGVGLLGNSIVLIIRIVHAGRITFTSGYDFTLWFVWGIVLLGFIAALVKQRLALLGALPIAVLVSMYGYLYFPDKAQSALPPSLRGSFWLYIHVALAIFAYGALALAAGWSVLYLIKHAATGAGKQTEDSETKAQAAAK